jgi:hypothetical protein
MAPVHSWMMVEAVTVGVRGRVAWAHDYDTDRSIGATFVLCRQRRGAGSRRSTR